MKSSAIFSLPDAGLEPRCLSLFPHNQQRHPQLMSHRSDRIPEYQIFQPAMAVGEHSGEHSTVQRPFERLDELLKRSSEASIACEETNHGRSKKS